MKVEATLIPGTAEVETWAPITEEAQLASIPALERDLHLFAEGRMVAWLVEMDTKYAQAEAVNRPYAPTGKAIARWYPPEAEDDEYDASVQPTELEITLPEEGEWALRVLTGRYDHYVVLIRQD